ANRGLRDAKLIEKVCISEIQFVEIYEELAIRTAHALCEIERSLRLARTKNEILAPAPYLLRGEGGFAGRPASDYDSGWWRRLQISQPAGDSGQLDFLLLTERARAERSMQATQRALVERLVEKTIHETSYDLNIPATLYELLVPNELKNQPLESANLLLVVDGAAAQYPWEMMAERRFMEDRVDNRELRPLAVHMGMLRQLTTARHRTLVQGPRKRTALVIGEPKLSDPNYPPLPGARAEAQAVVEVLSAQKYEVTALIETDAIAIVDALFSQEYRIIHIAGHGLYRPEHPEQSGVVLGDGIFLTAAEIGQLRIVPEMVFLNCCHLGRTDQPVPLPEGDLGQTQRAWNRLAASVAQALIEIGVRTVVAAGWAVNDSAAQVFATTLYGLLLDAEQSLPFGEAVCAARRKLYDDPQLGRTNTWGAYQCYGDPGFILNMQAKQEGG
ncbi:MAG TPA: CHAT domain-containing protein, partial [Caldilineaceae bacterium]|nr:CHAT domain-containing protein [Caldilineaceae bacterium]